jgi:hypothetical protein
MNDVSNPARSGSRRPRGIGYVDVAVLTVALSLAAMVALPRHTQITREVRRAQVDELATAVKGAAHLGHELWRAAGKRDRVAAPRGTVRIEHGYPVAADVGLLLEEPEAMAFRAGEGSWQLLDVPADRACGVSYEPPAADNQPPVVRAHPDGC